MRIEELSPGVFVKTPDQVEEILIKIMNRFFDTQEEAVKGSREDIVVEIQKRVTPIISNTLYELFHKERDSLISDIVNSPKFENKVREIAVEEINKVIGRR